MPWLTPSRPEILSNSHVGKIPLSGGVNFTNQGVRTHNRFRFTARIT